MNIVNRARASGKTIELLDILCSSDKYVLIVPNLTIKYHLVGKVYSMVWSGDSRRPPSGRIFTITEWTNVSQGRPYAEQILLDEVGMCLQAILKRDIHLGYYTNDIEGPDNEGNYW